jgi:ABC-type branched-subunit amino acid transport system substrate-binding protein
MVLFVALTLLVAACGGDNASSTTTTAGGATTTGGDTTTTAGALTDSFRGVTSTEIKIGIATVDFKCLTDQHFVDFNQGDTQKIANALIDDINANGGVLGRNIVPVYKEICPLDANGTSDACTSFTDDEQVFAVLGIYDPPPSDGSNQLCMAQDHETILIDELTTKAIVDQAPPGLLLTPGILPERRLDATLALMEKEGTLDGKTVALLADQNTQASAEEAVTAAATSMGIQQGSTAVLTISDTDTAQAQAQLDSFIEKWKGEGVNALVMSGLLVSAKQFVEKIRTAIPDMLLITDDSSTGEQAVDEHKSGVVPNPYEGMLSLAGLSDQETFETGPVQTCVKTYEDATGDTVVAPKDIAAGADGIRVLTYAGIQDRCNELTMLKLIAEKAGADLTNDSWVAAVNDYGPIVLPTTATASLHEGKYDADDGFRLAAWDSSIPPDGEYKPITEISDVTQ